MIAPFAEPQRGSVSKPRVDASATLGPDAKPIQPQRGCALFRKLTFLFLLILCFRTATAQTPLTPAETRGKQIYVQGTSASGREILAYIGESSLEVPGSSMPCLSCHALSGLGRPEGGIEPSNITWEALTKPYGVSHSSGRRHPAYIERAFEVALTRGLDPAGNKLLSAMPRYQMSAADFADLILYIKRLGSDLDPGIAENKITIGTALPAKGSLSELGDAVKAVITAAFAEINSQGGVYQRQLELKVTETGDTPALTRANLERLLKEEKIFALTGVFVAGAEAEVTSLVAQQEVPLIGPLTLDPRPGQPLNRQVFYLLSGNAGQARALLSFVAKQSENKKPSLAVLYPPSSINSSVVAAIKTQAEKEAFATPEVSEYAAGSFAAEATARLLQEKNTGAVFFLGSTTELVAFLNEADKLKWYPQMLLQSGGVAASVFDAPAGFEGKLFFTLPNSPADQSEAAINDYRVLAEKYKLPQKHLAAQISAYAATRLLIEGLKRAGKDVSRERLIQMLEGFYEYQTGLMPAITWGPNRRIGALGAYVVRVDLKGRQYVPVSGWISIN